MCMVSVPWQFFASSYGGGYFGTYEFVAFFSVSVDQAVLWAVLDLEAVRDFEAVLDLEVVLVLLEVLVNH